jgi:hypothetical protein
MLLPPMEKIKTLFLSFSKGRKKSLRLKVSEARDKLKWPKIQDKRTKSPQSLKDNIKN